MEKITVIDELKDIFQNVNYWLNFAEAKNAAIIAFDVAIIAALMSSNIFNNVIMIYYILIFGFVSSLVISVLSFAPNIDKNKPIKELINENDNILYFKHIAKYSPDDYLKKVHKYCNDNTIEDFSGLELNYAEEIIENSIIAVQKYKYFIISVKLNISLLFLMAILIILA